jgi:transposase
MEAVKEFKTKDKVLKIFIDESAENPRTLWDNLGTMVCFHRRYDLGDKHNYSSSDYDSWDEMEKAIIKQEDVAVILPLYLYDHSGITMNTTGFSCGWDSGQVGFIFVSRETLRNEYGVKRISNKIIEKATKLLLGEVETYDQYICGDVYGFKVFKVETCDNGCEHEEEIDSCWGFFGDNFIENGLIEHVDKEFAELLEK